MVANQLACLFISKDNINAVDARALWEHLGSKQEFSRWVKNRLDGFEEGNDFIVHKKMTQYNQIDTNNSKNINDITVGKKGDGNIIGKNIDYILTLDTAKHIAMRCNIYG